MIKILNSKIPLYSLIIILSLMSGGLIFIFLNFQEIIYDYKLYMPGTNDNEEIQFQYGSWSALSNQDFFGKVFDKFVSNKTTFIEADLFTMKMNFYKEGVLQKQYDILSKGKTGSWWETPTGVYKIITKEKNHFSSFGLVYQPYSMQFQGNFFIHGWPYYLDGSEVSSSYSGGCIRLSTADAEELFSFANIGIPVLVHENSLSLDNFKYYIRTPATSAKSYFAADLKNNFIFLKKNETKKEQISSITKLAVAIIAADYIDLDRKIEITENMIVPTFMPRLPKNQMISAFQLLFPLLMESSNESAMAFSETLGNERFVSLMNDKAKSLGMTETYFADPTGLSTDNVSTAENLFFLAKNIYDNRSFILKISAGKIKNSVYGTPIFKNLENYNGFAENPEFLGGVVGQIGDNQALISIFEIIINNETRPIGIIILDSKNGIKDALSILNYVKLIYNNEIKIE